MSASTPGNRSSNPNGDPDRTGTAPRRGEARSGGRPPALAGAELRFWGVSLAVHAVGLALVLFVSPVRQIVFRRELLEEPQVVTRGDELEAVIEEIRDLTVEKLRDRVALLDAGQDRMARNFATLNQYFQPFADEQRRTARERLEKYVAEALPQQDRLQALLTTANESGDPAAAIAFAQTCLSRILIAQEEIRRGIRLLDVGGDDLLELQHSAEEAQYAASQALRGLGEDEENAASEGLRLSQLQLASEQQSLLSAPAEEAVLGAAEAVAFADAARRQKEALWQEERRHRNPAREEAAKTAMDAARQEWNESRRLLSEAENSARRTADEARRLAAEIPKSTERLRIYSARRSEHLRSALVLQAEAYARQKSVVDRLATLPPEASP